MRRTQTYLDEGQASHLDQRAAAEGVTRSTLIRRAEEHYLTHDHDDPAAWRAQWEQAVSETAGLAPSLPYGAGYVESLRAADAVRLERDQP